MRKARKVDLAAAMRAHVAATVLMAQHCIDAAASHRPLTLPELRTAEAYWLAFAIKSVRENWSKQGLPPTTLDLFAEPLERHYRKLFASQFYADVPLASVPPEGHA